MAESQHADASGVNNKVRVFRLRNLPRHVDRLDAVELLCHSVNGITAQDIQISSLAFEVGDRSPYRTQVATMTLQKMPSALDLSLKAGECTIRVPGLEKPLIVDHHFQGVTPLNHVPDGEHEYDCLVISGLASHPFGSWQVHGPDKSFMWIRDELRHKLPSIRFLIYGYDTTLWNSKSCQTTLDLAMSLVETMRVIGWSAPSARPVLFLAHSLGGVVLKQALINLAGGDDVDRAMLEKVRGAICFGVPSQGMRIPDILEMLGNQPNRDFVTELSNESTFLHRLDEQFGNISYLQSLQFFWAFETKVTPSVEKAVTSGNFARTGPGTIMVSRESATRKLYHLQPSSTMQIDENHSDMVKFGIASHYIEKIASNLSDICSISKASMPAVTPPLARKLRQGDLVEETKAPNSCNGRGKTHSPQRSPLPPEWTSPKFWDDNKILSSLRAPERDRRLEQISQKLGNTFNWVYDDTSVGLSEWLQNGTGIFWVNGKPASGKSTLMKYLYQDPRTHKLLRAGGWKSGARLTKASFFFHHRGNSIQKSFEGLLRSLVSQILEQERSLYSLLYPILVDQYRTLVVSSGLDNLEKDLWALVSQLEIPSYSQLLSQVEKIVTSQRELTDSRQLGLHLERMLKDFNVDLDSQPKGPYDEAGLDNVEMILSSTIEPSRQPVHGKIFQWLEPTSWRVAVNRTLQRHYRRERVKMDLQEQQWSRENLEECLRQLIGQSLFKMDLFLFLDALDEYDGTPEFIASFLRGLVQQSANLSEQSSTRIRVLFSSRPWKVLNEEFGAFPGFQIHDYTWYDIIDFCEASIPSDETAKSVLSPFVTEIARRACGVFLWVELVMRDLAQTVLERVQQRDVEGLEQELRKTLDEVPDELDSYYQIVVQRMPPDTRWQSYVVLETICRAGEDVELATLLAILRCSNSSSLADAKLKLNKGLKMSLPGPKPDWGDIKAVSGGLVEVGGLSSKGKPIVQFMHQTVKQFVLGPRFKVQLLGKNLGPHVTENGYSFISKYLFANSRLGTRLFYYARQAEATTGFSQYGFFSTASQSHYSAFSRVVSERLPSMLAMAVLAGLRLCVSDAYDADQSFIQRNSKSLVTLLFDTDNLLFSYRNAFQDLTFDLEGSQDEERARIVDMAKVLVQKGLSIDDVTFMNIVPHVWAGVSRPKMESAVWVPMYESLALTLVDALPRRSESKAAASFLSMNTQPLVPSKYQLPHLLHCATPELARAMLARGFDPNFLDYCGATPIDSVLAGENWSLMESGNKLLHQYEIVSQLVQHGGLLSSTKRSRWIEWENACAGSGLDLSVFRDAGFPLWYSRTKAASKHRSLRWSLFGSY